MPYLYGVHKQNAVEEIVSVYVFQFENSWTDVDEIWY
jgi:hypothetical protein